MPGVSTATSSVANSWSLTGWDTHLTKRILHIRLPPWKLFSRARPSRDQSCSHEFGKECIKMRTDISFKVEGLTCRGWYYRPDGVNETEKLPVVLLLTGFGGVKEFAISTFAELFVAHGFSAIVYDNRYTGDSDGEPRGRIVPSLQHDDLRTAIGWALERQGVDQKKVILWGTSFGGSHALFVGALDPRVSAVITLVAGLGSRGSFEADRKAWDALWGQLTDDFMKHQATGDDLAIPIVAPPGQPCLLRDEALSAWLRNLAPNAPRWPNRVTFESRIRLFEFVPTAFIDAI